MLFNLKKGHWIILSFTILYILIFTTYYLLKKNYEFLWYVAIMLFFFTLIILTIKKSNFDYIVLWGLSIWGLLHMAGGAIQTGDGVLYAFRIFPIIDLGGEFFILKMDQLIHAYGFAVTTLVAWFLLKPQLKNKPDYKLVYPLLIFIAMGAGALNEIAEFISTIIYTGGGVGGYVNTALDLVFNTIGSIFAVIFIHFYYRKSELK